MLLECKRAHLFDDAVFLLVVKEEVKINCQDAHVLVVVKHLLEELVFKLAKKVKRLFRNSNFLCPFKEFNTSQVDLFQWDHTCRVDPLAEHKCLLVHSPQV